MIIDPPDFWCGDRLKATAFIRARQLIFELKGTAEAIAPRRKSETTHDVAEGVLAGAAHAIAWDFSPERTQAAAALLRDLADQVEADGLKSVAWGPCPTFDPTPVTFPAVLTSDGASFMITSADYPEVLIGGDADDDRDEIARQAFEDAVLERLSAGECLPPDRTPRLGEVEVAVRADVGEKVLRHWSYDPRHRAARRARASAGEAAHQDVAPSE